MSCDLATVDVKCSTYASYVCSNLEPCVWFWQPVPKGRATLEWIVVTPIRASSAVRARRASLVTVGVTAAQRWSLAVTPTRALPACAAQTLGAASPAGPAPADTRAMESSAMMSMR